MTIVHIADIGLCDSQKPRQGLFTYHCTITIVKIFFIMTGGQIISIKIILMFIIIIIKY